MCCESAAVLSTTTSVASIAAEISSSATVSLVRCATVAAVGAPTASPTAQPRLSTIVASAIATPSRSAVSVITDIDAIIRPVDGPPRAITVRTARPSAEAGSGSAAIRSAVTNSPRAIGSLGPRRSTSRPIRGEVMVARSEASTNVTPIATPDAPNCDRRSGNSVAVAPIIAASSTISQTLKISCGLLASARTGVWRSRSSGGGSGYWRVQAASASETAPTPAKTISVPTATASVPTIGPSSVPKTAAAITEPSTSPRRSRGTSAITHARPPLHMQPHAAPWTNRSRSSVAISLANPNGMIETVNIRRPTIVVRRTPARVAIQPPSSAPGIMPAG